MAPPSASTDPTAISYSFVTKKDERESIELMKTVVSTTKDDIDKEKSEQHEIKFKILKGSLTANNKFYLEFGERSPFNFFKCYPIDSQRSILVSLQADSSSIEKDYAHPCV